MEVTVIIFFVVVLAAAIFAGVFSARAVFRKLTIAEGGKWAVAVLVFLLVACVVVFFAVGGCVLLFMA